MDWYPHYISDYDADTIHLTPFEDGCYSRLLRWYYLNERPIPNDDKILATICRISVVEWSGVSDVIKAFFVTRDKRVTNASVTNKASSFLVHKRCDAVIEATNKKRKDGKERQEKRRKFSGIDDVTRDNRVSHALVTQPEERIGEESIREKESDGADAPDDDYAYVGKVLRYTQRDYAALRAAYPHLHNLNAILDERDEWLSEQPADGKDRKNWFHSTSQALSSKNKKQKQLVENGLGGL